MSWLSKAAILRDLSRAQGCVPVDVAGAVAAADQPPSPENEEKEDEFFIRNYTGCAGELSEPDLGLIKQMLNMVQEYNCPREEEDDNVIEISNINSLHLRNNANKLETGEPVHAPKQQEKTRKKVKEKKLRNVAIMSLLQNQEVERQTTEKLPPDVNNAVDKVNVWLESQEKPKVTSSKKPGFLDLEVFMTFKKKSPPGKASQIKSETVKSPFTLKNNYEISEKVRKPLPLNAIEKVNVWLEPQDKPKEASPKKAGLLTLDPCMLFKKKPAAEKPPLKSCGTMRSPMTVLNNNYIPSEKAMQHYKKCQENSKMKELVVEDMWSRVEKEMKVIDEMRKNFSECLKLTRSMISMDSASSTSDFDDPKFDAVRLPYYRHSLASDCIVCAVKLKNDQQSPAHCETWWRSTPNPNVENEVKKLETTFEVTKLEESYKHFA